MLFFSVVVLCTHAVLAAGMLLCLAFVREFDVLELSSVHVCCLPSHSSSRTHEYLGKVSSKPFRLVYSVTHCVVRVGLDVSRETKTLARGTFQAV